MDGYIFGISMLDTGSLLFLLIYFVSFIKFNDYTRADSRTRADRRTIL
jgi:hypothetical protein